MTGFQRAGGLAAIAAAATYIVGFWVFFTFIAPASYGSSQVDASEHVMFLVENEQLMQAWNLVIFVLNAILMVIISIALYHRVKTGSEHLAQAATAFGVIWAGLLLASGMLANIGLEEIVKLSARDMQAASTLWYSVATVEEGLGGGNEITGGMWILLLSWAGQKAKTIPSVINLIGLLVGGAGVLTMIPILTEAETVFGLGFILWFLLVGLALLCTPSKVHANRGV